MVSGNIKYNKVIHKKLKKCEYCGRELTPIGLEYLYLIFLQIILNMNDVLAKKHKNIGKRKTNKIMKWQKESILERL